jgi:hypothetical protein
MRLNALFITNKTLKLKLTKNDKKKFTFFNAFNHFLINELKKQRV